MLVLLSSINSQHKKELASLIDTFAQHTRVYTHIPSRDELAKDHLSLPTFRKFLELLLSIPSSVFAEKKEAMANQVQDKGKKFYQ